MAKAHVGEVDYLRVFGLVTIVVIHAFGFFLLMPAAGPYSRIFQELSINLLRFGRQIFMFVTGVVLFYNYTGCQVDTARFFNHRLKNLFIPYAVWTVIYLLIDYWSNMFAWPGFSGFTVMWLQSLFTGNAFSHLYYIVVAMQFYLLFPLIAAFKPRRPCLYAWGVTGGGLALYAFYHYVLEVHGAAVMSMVAGTLWAGPVSWIMFYKDRLLVSYLPYYLLGAIAGLYWQSWRLWLERHRVAIVNGLVAGLAMVTGEYFYLHHHLGQAWGVTISVFKPSLYLYSLAVITFVFQLAFILERRGRLRPLIESLAANSLGIYLIHPAVLFLIHSYVWPYQNLPWYLLAVLDPVAGIAISWWITCLLGGNGYTRFIVGEAGGLRQYSSRAKMHAGQWVGQPGWHRP